jgi:hypothetical protein
MDDKLADILDQCVERIERGASVDECLVAFPAIRADLELPLRMAVRLRALPRPALPVVTRAALETKLLQLAAERRATHVPNPVPANSAAAPASPARPRWYRIASSALAELLCTLGYRSPTTPSWLRLAAVAVTVVLALVLSAGALAAASAVIGIVHPQPSSAPSVAPTAAPIAFEGQIEQLSQERWLVSGRVILLDSQTLIRGKPMPGMTAHVHGTLMVDDVLLADSILIEAAPATLTPSVVPTATLAPSAVPPATPTPVIVPTATLAPSAVLSATSMTSNFPTVTPAPPSAQTQPTPNESEGGNHPCHGQQLGREDNKCDPKPHDDRPKDDKPKDDKPKDDKPKDNKGPHK